MNSNIPSVFSNFELYKDGINHISVLMISFAKIWMHPAISTIMFERLSVSGCRYFKHTGWPPSTLQLTIGLIIYSAALLRQRWQTC